MNAPAWARRQAARSAYSLLEVATRGRGVVRAIDGEELRLAPRWARYYPASYEPAKLAFLDHWCRPGTTAFDIGAHVGVYSVVMGRRVSPGGQLHSFEPTPETRASLARTILLNDLDGVVVVHADAVGAAMGQAVFNDTGDTMSNANSLVLGARTRSSYVVPVTTVDAVVADSRATAVSCLKIDVEGAELDVLAGAAATIEEHRPGVALEVHPDVLGEAGLVRLWEWCDGVGYALAEAGAPRDLTWLLAQRGGIEVELVPRGGPGG